MSLTTSFIQTYWDLVDEYAERHDLTPEQAERRMGEQAERLARLEDDHERDREEALS